MFSFYHSRNQPADESPSVVFSFYHSRGQLADESPASGVFFLSQLGQPVEVVAVSVFFLAQPGPATFSVCAFIYNLSLVALHIFPIRVNTYCVILELYR